MNSPVISITNLSKSYYGNQVLKNLNWTVEQGDIIALLGKNGAGKSTLLESIMDLREADSGELKVWQQDWDQLQQQHRERIAFVAQETAGFEWMRVRDFLNYLGGFFPSWDQNYCEQLQQRWTLDPQQRVGTLSGGQTQIMHVIQALSSKPELLILDEPVAHLDPNMRRQFLGELIELSIDQKSTVIFSSHIVSDLERVANKVALLKEGNIQHYHDIEMLKSSIAHVKIASSEPLQQTGSFAEFSNWKAHSYGATATITQPLTRSLSSLEQDKNIKIELTPMSLEDWYLEVSHASH